MKYKLLHLIMIFILSACAYTPDNYLSSEKIDTAGLSTVKKIALLDVPVPSGVWLGSPGSGEVAGFFGPLVALASANHKGDRIVNPTALSARIHDDAKTWLESAGFEVTTLKAQRSNPSKMLQSYDQFRDLDADAILEIGTWAIGFRAEVGKIEFSESELSPDVGLIFRLVSVKTGETIVESSVGYSSFVYSQDLAAGVILGPRSHIFRGVEAVENNRSDAVRKLEFAIKGATEYVASIIANDNKGISYSAYGGAKLQASEEKSKESSAGLRTILAGSTRSGTTSKGLEFHIYYAPDGEMFGRTTTKRNTESNDTGTWEVNQDDQICQQWKRWRDGKRYCFTMTPLGGNRYLTISTGTRNLVSRGDTQGLDTRVANRKATAAEMVATLSAIQKSIGVRSLSGKYVSEITGKAAQFLKSSFTETSDRILTLSQDGRNLTGELGTSGNIWGKASGMSVTFEYFVNGMDGKGEWSFTEDGSTATGKWVPNSTLYNLSDGPYEWNLKRVE